MSGSWSGTITHVVRRNGEEVELEIEGSVSAIILGKYHGPPEDCYPDEGGDVEILKVTRNGIDITDEALTSAEQEEVETKLREAAESSYEGDFDDYRHEELQEELDRADYEYDPLKEPDR